MTACIIPVSVSANSASLFTPERIEKMVARAFPDSPEMVAIARCESGFRQYTDGEQVLRGGLGGNMIGIFQFHEKYHRAAALQLGHDIDSPVGNIGYARVLFASSGTTPWNASNYCWQSAVPVQPSSKLLPVTRNIQFGATGTQVRRLTTALTSLGYSTSVSSRYNRAVMLAVMRFQCASDIACSARVSEYGKVGNRTRRELNALIVTPTTTDANQTRR
jgi:hypothetical protein